MNELTVFVEALRERLSKLGIVDSVLTEEGAGLRVPLLPFPSRHLSLDAAPLTIVVSVYEIAGGTVASRADQLLQLKAEIHTLTPTFFAPFTWTSQFFDWGFDFLVVFFGGGSDDLVDESRARQLIRQIANLDGADHLSQRIQEAFPLPPMAR